MPLTFRYLKVTTGWSGLFGIVSSLQTDEEEELFPTCPTETQEERHEDDEDNESERTTNVSPGRTTGLRYDECQ